jgi:hypothetical protein
MRPSGLHHFTRRACADDLSARVAALRPEIDQPVGRGDDVEVVLDHQQRMTGLQQAPERVQELRNVVEVQTRRRLIEQEQRARRTALAARALLRLPEMSRELQALRLAAGQRGHGLTELEIVEADFDQRPQPRQHLALAGEEFDCF